MRRSGPLAVQRLFYPEAQESFRAGAASAASPAQPAEAYILHPPGGLVRGDSLFIEAQAREGARILLSQASAAKIYGIGRPRARHMAQRQAIWVRVGPGSELEWLPLESIVFDGAMASLSGHFVLDEEARLVVSDILCLGRPASGAPFLEGSLDSKLSLVRPGGRPIYWDNLVLEGGSPLISGLPGLMGQSVSSFFLAAGRCGNAKDESALETAMEKLRPLSRPGPLSGLPPYRGISLREGLLTARSLGQSGAEAKAFALAAWQCLRPLLLGRPAYGLRGWGP
jgi:urease accessory protein